MGILNIKQRQKETKYENKIKKTKKGFLFFNIQGQRNSKAISFWKWNKNENIFCLAGKKLFWMCKLKTLLLFWRRNKQMEENIQQIFCSHFSCSTNFCFAQSPKWSFCFEKEIKFDETCIFWSEETIFQLGLEALRVKIWKS